MEKMGILPIALLATALFLALPCDVVGGHVKGYQCKHKAEKPTVGVYIAGSDGPVRDRRSPRLGTEFKPMRLALFYDNSVNTELSLSARNRLQNIVMPKIKDYIERALNVTPLTGPILLDRNCNGSFFLPTQRVKECVDRCVDVPMCSDVVIPQDHLKRCVECRGSRDTCGTRPDTADGAGIPNADMVIYIATKPCSGEGELANAVDCQLESKFDRPIAGRINFCPEAFTRSSDRNNIETGIHELIHALVFSDGLYPFYRDIHGNPRTPRDVNGFPPENPETGMFETSNNTVATVTYDDWLTRDGTVSHQVKMIVTPKVVEEAKAQFGCNDVIGVELENQGGGGTAGAHWEHRVVGNEAMAGVILFNGLFSRITFALFEDSGWYRANYSLTEPLAWGRNRGCNIPHGSCAAHIKEQQASQRTLSPFCNVLESQEEAPKKRTCTVDRDRFAACSLVDTGAEIPPEYQYFNEYGRDLAPRLGSSFEHTDYCPFEHPDSTDIQASCSNSSDLRTPNAAGETYGPGSRCIEHGRTWTRAAVRDGLANNDVGVGCYQYSCSQSGVEIYFLGTRYLCSCEGEELVVNTTIGDAHYEGSFICPSCLSLCYDQVDKCPSPEPPACPGRVTLAGPAQLPATTGQVPTTTVQVPTTTLPELVPSVAPTASLPAPADVQTFCSHVVWRIPSDVPCEYIHGYDVRLVNSVTNQDVVRRVDTSATFYKLGYNDESSAKESTSVQVRLISTDYNGPFSPLTSLGCQPPEPSVYFELRGEVLANNSVINMADVGTGENALLCKTDRESCCGTLPDRAGEFYYPNGAQVPIRAAGQGFYRDRRAQRIRLNRRPGMNSPTGVFRCEIPDASGVNQKLFITLTNSGPQ